MKFDFQKNLTTKPNINWLLIVYKRFAGIQTFYAYVTFPLF